MSLFWTRRTVGPVLPSRMSSTRPSARCVHSNKRLRGERGDVTPFVILAPIAIFLILWVIQMGLYFHARSILSAAAQDGARAAQQENGTAGDATSAANQIMAGSTNLLLNPSVDVSISIDEVTVRVTADVNNVLPFWGGGEISSTATGPTERFRNEAER